MSIFYYIFFNQKVEFYNSRADPTIQSPNPFTDPM